METAGYIGDVNVGEELFVWTAFQVAKAFAEVDVKESFVLDWAHGGDLEIWRLDSHSRGFESEKVCWGQSKVRAQ